MASMKIINVINGEMSMRRIWPGWPLCVASQYVAGQLWPAVDGWRINGEAVAENKCGNGQYPGCGVCYDRSASENISWQWRLCNGSA